MKPMSPFIDLSRENVFYLSLTILEIGLSSFSVRIVINIQQRHEIEQSHKGDS